MPDDPTNLAESSFEPQNNRITLSPQHNPLILKIPAASMNLRRSNRRMSSAPSLPSGSEYHASEKSVDMDEQPDEEEPKEEEPPEEVITTKRGRQVKKMKYVESSDNDGEGEDDPDIEIPAQDLFNESSNRKVTRASTAKRHISEEDEEEDNRPRRLTRGARLNGFIASDEEEKEDDFQGYSLRNRTRRPPSAAPLSKKEKEQQQKQKQQAARAQRISRRNAARTTTKDEDYEHVSSGASADADGSLDDAQQSSDHDALGLPEEPEPEPEPEDDGDGKPYSLRQRKNISYAIPAPLEELVKANRQGGKGGGRNGAGGSRAKPRLGWSTSGKELGRLMGADDSVSCCVERLLFNGSYHA